MPICCLKQLDQAELEIDKALAIEPKSGPALVTMSQILQSKGKFAVGANL